MIRIYIIKKLIMIPEDIWQSKIASMLTAREICSVRSVSKTFKIFLKPFANLKVVNDIRLEKFSTIFSRVRRVCRFCGAIFRSRTKLFKHLRQFPVHCIEPLTIQVHLSRIRIVNFMDSACVYGICDCSKQIMHDLRASVYPIILSTVLGTFMIRNIQFWISQTGDAELGIGYITCNNSVIRLYKWRKHYWISFASHDFYVVQKVVWSK